MIALIGAVALLAVLWQEHRAGITLPAPQVTSRSDAQPNAWVNDAKTDNLRHLPKPIRRPQWTPA